MCVSLIFFGLLVFSWNSDGLGQSCLFAALYLLTSQLSLEGQVDVVATFRSIRSDRPGALYALVSYYGSLKHNG